MVLLDALGHHLGQLLAGVADGGVEDLLLDLGVDLQLTIFWAASTIWAWSLASWASWNFLNRPRTRLWSAVSSINASMFSPPSVNDPLCAVELPATGLVTRPRG
ncbi:MAG: hypothetical protein ACRD2W_12900 [Acidimicrobiales bacterium]